MWDGTEISLRVYSEREEGVVGSLEARRVAEGNRSSFWQAVVIDLFSGGAAWWHSPSGAASLEAGVDAVGARGDLQRHWLLLQLESAVHAGKVMAARIRTTEIQIYT